MTVRRKVGTDYRPLLCLLPRIEAWNPMYLAHFAPDALFAKLKQASPSQPSLCLLLTLRPVPNSDCNNVM
jgi:hypothetical protein